MPLSVVRSVDTARSLRGTLDAEDFEQELVDQYSLAMAAAGITDDTASGERGVVFEFVSFLGRPVWTAQAEDADRYLRWLRGRALARSTVASKAGVLARFFDFLIGRYQGDIHALFGVVVAQPIDEFNRPQQVLGSGAVRVPPREDEVRVLFEEWRDALPDARKYLPAARDYLAASLWRRIGLRINETVMLDVSDWHPELGDFGKLHVRYGKGSRGRGPKVRLVPAIDQVDSLMHWWFTDVRHQFGDDYDDPGAPLLPSERRDPMTGRCTRIGAEALRAGLSTSVGRWLPSWSSRLSPHGLRHFCASRLYERGMTLKAIQELMGHSWLSTTTLYIHVHDEHIERSWAQANSRVLDRYGGRIESPDSDTLKQR